MARFRGVYPRCARRECRSRFCADSTVRASSQSVVKRKLSTGIATRIRGSGHKFGGMGDVQRWSGCHNRIVARRCGCSTFPQFFSSTTNCTVLKLLQILAKKRIVKSTFFQKVFLLRIRSLYLRSLRVLSTRVSSSTRKIDAHLHSCCVLNFHRKFPEGTCL
jgi:hypothetical protein